MSTARALRLALGAGLLCLLPACGQQAGEPQAMAGVIEGQGAGPYRMRLGTAPAAIKPGEETRLTWQLTHAASGKPVEQLQVMHERVVHNFIVNLDFSSFAHIHHEDFKALTADDLKRATFTLPYRFPRAGHYRIVSDFTHRNRNWIRQFDVTVGTPPPQPTPPADFSTVQTVGEFQGRLSMSPAVPVAGYETELVLKLARGDAPVTDLALILGSEVHVALWREDGQHFGHTHSYTPHMASMLGAMHDKALDADARARMMADMMVMMMNMPAELVFHGPEIPIHYVFPEPGVYHLFLQCAPGGTPRVFHFAVKVEHWREGMTTRIDSIVTGHDGAP
ncbi:MAG: hypothetical protein IT492_15230 [Gammaproteobacteria bacterium]|nr:hypothetical protein [Gammaproteobacteria bacterium]